MTEINDNLRRLRFITNAKPPQCCKKPMLGQFLNFSGLSEEQMSDMTEQEYADYLAESMPRPPVWCCQVCDNEQDIEGLDWPEWIEKEMSDE